MKDNLNALKTANDKLQAKLNAAQKLNESISRRLKETSRKNEKLIADVARLKQRIKTKPNPYSRYLEYDSCLPSMAPVGNFETQNRLLMNRNQLRPRPPAQATVTSTVLSDIFPGQYNVQNEQPLVFRFDKQPATNDSEVLNKNGLDEHRIDLVDLLVVDDEVDTKGEDWFSYCSSKNN